MRLQVQNGSLKRQESVFENGSINRINRTITINLI
jgi:hypothetical protein